MTRRSRVVMGVGVVGLLAAAGLAYAYAGRLFGHEPKSGVSVTGTIEATQVDVSVKITGRILARLRSTRVIGSPRDRSSSAWTIASWPPRPSARKRRCVPPSRPYATSWRAPAPEEIKEARATMARSRARHLLVGSRVQEIEEAKASVQSAEASRQLKERQGFTRVEELYRRALVALQDVDRAREAHEVLTAQERAARERLAMVIAGPRPHQIEAARADLAAAEQRLALLKAGPRPDQLEAARGQLAQARSALAIAKTRLKDGHCGLTPHRGGPSEEPGGRRAANPGVLDPRPDEPSRDLGAALTSPRKMGARSRSASPARVTIDGFPNRAGFPVG